MQVGELVWVRRGPDTPTWGIVIDELVIYLTDNSVMVSYEVLVNSAVYQVDNNDVLRFNYYNRHLKDDTNTMENR